MPSIPNPAVMRALSELRKVANAILRKYGKPTQVRIELARDFKRNTKQREFDWRRPGTVNPNAMPRSSNPLKPTARTLGAGH